MKELKMGKKLLALVISIVLGIRIGIVGVLIGTLVSTMLPLIIKPIIVYRHVFETNPIRYFKDSLKQIMVLLFSLFISIIIIYYVDFNNIVLKLGFNLIISIIIPGSLILIAYHKSDVLKSTVSRARYLIYKRKKLKY